MRSFSAGFASKLADNSYLPVIFCKYELVTYADSLVTTDFFWSERAITYSSQSYEARLVNTSPIEQELDGTHQVLSSMGLQLSNSPTNLAGVIQAGMKCTVYLGFETAQGSGQVTDAEIIFKGTVDGGIEITEDSVSFSLEDIVYSYDRQLPFLIKREHFPQADPDAIGDTKPIIMGRVADLECRPVGSGFGTTLALDALGDSWSQIAIKGKEPPVMSSAGSNYIHVSDDIGWWIDAHGGFFSNKLIINTFSHDFYGSVVGYCNLSDGDASEEACTAIGGTWITLTEEIFINGIEFDNAENLWKINLSTNLKTDHSAGDTIYIEEPVEGYAYLVADHPVEAITNVKVDGFPQPYSEVILDSSPVNGVDNPSVAYWNLPYGKAYVIAPTQAGNQAKSGTEGLTIVDTIDVDDTIDVNDTIEVDEPEKGHHHTERTLGGYEHTIEYNWDWFINSTGYIRVEIHSGNFSTTILLRSGLVAIPNIFVASPMTFTSDSKEVTMTYVARGTYDIFVGFGHAEFLYLELKGSRLDSDGGVTTAVASVGRAGSGSLLLNYPDVAPEPFEKAEVFKVGTAVKEGVAAKIGTVTLGTGNSAADILVGTKVTCDVVGICDGSTGYITPHNQIKKFINTYAANQGGMAVNFIDEAGMDAEFSQVYNSASGTVASSQYPALNINSTSTDNPSPNAAINPSLFFGGISNISGFRALDFAITEPNRFRNIVGEMLYHSNCIINWRNGDAFIRHYSDNLVKDGAITDADLIMKSMTLSRSTSSDLATEVEVRYDHSQKKDYSRRYEYIESLGIGRYYSPTQPAQQQALGSKSKESNYDLPMVRDQISAEFVAKRIFDKYSASKFTAGVSTVLKNMAIECGDIVSASIPIYNNGSLDKGMVMRRTFELGSAIDKSPDLIHLTIKENHTDNGFFLGGSVLVDSLAVADATPTITLNDVNSKFQILTDSLSITETVDVQPVSQLTDTVALSESFHFGFDVNLTDSIAIDDNQLSFTGILFWNVSLADVVLITDTATAVAVDSVYEAGVYVGTDLVNIGVFE